MARKRLCLGEGRIALGQGVVEWERGRRVVLARRLRGRRVTDVVVEVIIVCAADLVGSAGAAGSADLVVVIVVLIAIVSTVSEAAHAKVLEQCAQAVCTYAKEAARQPEVSQRINAAYLC